MGKISFFAKLPSEVPSNELVEPSASERAELLRLQLDSLTKILEHGSHARIHVAGMIVRSVFDLLPDTVCFLVLPTQEFYARQTPLDPSEAQTWTLVDLREHIDYLSASE